jgi:hypothetical protein
VENPHISVPLYGFALALRYGGPRKREAEAGEPLSEASGETSEPPNACLQIGHYVKQLSPEYTGERHVVTVGRLADGTYHWERPGPAPKAGKRTRNACGPIDGLA